MAEVIVIGAGMAGSVAARALQAAGHAVVVVDKGYAVGGRMAARSVDGARFDVGAQFLTAKSATFVAMTARWAEEGVLRTWFHGSPDRQAPRDPDGHPRMRGTPTMRRIVEHLTTDLDLRLGRVVHAITPAGDGAAGHGPTAGRAAVHLGPRPPERTAGADARTIAGGSGAARRTLTADAVLSTMPIPQTRAVLAAGGVTLERSAEQRLAAASYEPCLTVLAVPDGPTSLPARGAVRDPDGDVTWITDHQVAGTSPQPALTIHTSAAYSRARFEADAEVVRAEVAELAAPLLGTTATGVYLHRWRYAKPTAALGDAPVVDRIGGALFAVAGDAFRGGRVEGAALSGLDAADALIDALAAGGA